MKRPSSPPLVLMLLALAPLACGGPGKKTRLDCGSDQPCESGACFEGHCYTACDEQADCAPDELCVRRDVTGEAAPGICLAAAEVDGCTTAADCDSLVRGPCDQVDCDAAAGRCRATPRPDGLACTSPRTGAGACEAGRCTTALAEPSPEVIDDTAPEARTDAAPDAAPDATPDADATPDEAGPADAAQDDELGPTDVAGPDQGELVVSTPDTIVNPCAAVVDEQVPAGSTSLHVDDAAAFAPGDEVLVLQVQGHPTAGLYDRAAVVSVEGNLLTLAAPLAHAYASTPLDQPERGVAAEVVRVPNYADVTIEANATLTAAPWDGRRGGVVALHATGTVSVAGAIDVSGKGFRGGAAPQAMISCDTMPTITSLSGEGPLGPGTTSTARNGGGGGAGNSGICGVIGAHPGGGGSYGTSGSVGTFWLPGIPGQPGATYGSADLQRLFLGSGGGAGGAHDVGYPTDGGAGGGLIFVLAGALTVDGGSLAADGGDTEEPHDYGGAGGGGSGGSILVAADGPVALGEGAVRARGGASPWQANGGDGRVRVLAPDVTGTSTPAAYTGPASGVSLNPGGLLAGEVNDATALGDVPAGASVLPVSDGRMFWPGDEVLVLQVQDQATAGTWEAAVVADADDNTVTLAAPLQHGYVSGAYDVPQARVAEVLRVPRFVGDVTVAAATRLTAAAWNGTTGGVLALRVQGALRVEGTLDVAGKGFRGGAVPYSTIACDTMPTVTSTAGESFGGLGTATTAANGGGGGASSSGVCSVTGAISAGGGGYGTAGLSQATGDVAISGEGGLAYGIPDLSRLHLGSGGGAGGAHDVGRAAAGGAGGGALYVEAEALTVAGGIITADGDAGGTPDPWGGAGGGGAGGSLLLSVAGEVQLGDGMVHALGGIGPWGGNGGDGRVRVDGSAVTGTTIPAFYAPQTR